MFAVAFIFMYVFTAILIWKILYFFVDMGYFKEDEEPFLLCCMFWPLSIPIIFAALISMATIETMLRMYLSVLVLLYLICSIAFMYCTGCFDFLSDHLPKISITF